MIKSAILVFLVICIINVDIGAAETQEEIIKTSVKSEPEYDHNSFGDDAGHDVLNQLKQIAKNATQFSEISKPLQAYLVSRWPTPTWYWSVFVGVRNSGFSTNVDLYPETSEQHANYDSIRYGEMTVKIIQFRPPPKK